MKSTKTLLGSAFAAALAFGASAALAQTPGVSFGAQTFTVNPGAVGLAGPSFTARFLDFSYSALIDQAGIPGTNTGNFTETGFGTFSSFRTELGNVAPISAETSGLNLRYNLYATFIGTGTVASNAGGGLDGQFNTFNVSFFVDPNRNTSADANQAPTNNADDIRVLDGTLRVGQFRVFPGLANGDFDVVFNATAVGGFFGGSAFMNGMAVGDFNGVNTSITGVTPPPGSFVRGTITGSGNTFFVPAPGSLALMGLGLMALAPIVRRRKA